MKKVKLKGKLTLNKQTITRLNSQQMGAIYGGSAEHTVCFDTEECGISVEEQMGTNCQGTSAKIWCDMGETLANNQTCDAAAGCQTSSPCESSTPVLSKTIAGTVCLDCYNP